MISWSAQFMLPDIPFLNAPRSVPIVRLGEGTTIPLLVASWSEIELALN